MNRTLESDPITYREGAVPVLIHKIESALMYQFHGHLTLEDLESVHAAEIPYFAALQDGQCLNILADMTAIDAVAPSLFPQLQQMRMVTDEHICIVVVIGANPYLRALTLSLGGLNGHHDFIFCRALDEALHILKSRDGR
jgi:hypothetical protein